jgi:peptidoglycan-N-acetylglucosamine deacetylase
MAHLLGAVTGLTLLGYMLTAIPGVVVELVRRGTPDVVFYTTPLQPVVALSIDDGPSAATPEILAVLEEHGVRATFFVIGNQLRQYPELAERMTAVGHELGHHMMYDEPSIGLPAEAFLARFDSVDSKLRELGGSRLFRPGSGWFDDRMVEVAAARGYRTVLGSIYPFDAHLPFPGFASWYVLEHTVPGDIIVLHDGAERGLRTAEVLRRVLPELRRRGYEIVTVSELLERSQRPKR